MAIFPSSRQIRGARAMLRWSMVDLAMAAGVSVSTVKRVEESAHEPVKVATMGYVVSALEEAGVRFLADQGEGEGVRVRSD